MRLMVRLGSLALLSVLAWCVQASYGSPLSWPANQFFPTFPAPAGTIDCVDVDGLPNDQRALFCSLEGIVNRSQPRMACVSAASEGEFTWMNIHGLSYDTLTGFNALLKYKTNVTGLVVYDTNQWDTLNLATTIAGVKNELLCDGALLSTLTNSPYNLTVKDDLRGMFSTKYQVYNYLYTNYWAQCNHRILGGLETNQFWYLRDYLVAERCAVMWLDPGSVSADATAMQPFVSSMLPVNSIYIGWWPNETADMQWIGQHYGIPVMASDLFDNGTLYGGVTHSIAVPAIPAAPPLQNKIYVSITLSDGDNVQYMQHTLYQNWQSSSRGEVPIGWTVQPLLADFDPAMMNYFSSTASTDDCLVAGPSGAGYTRINYWSATNVAAYTEASNPYLQEDGIRMITVWLNVSAATANTYATNCPTLVGINDQSDGYFTTNYKGLPTLGFPSTGNYATNAAELVSAITNAGASWSGSSPMFIAVQGSAWDVKPADCQTVAGLLPANYVVVRPDHLFLLYRQAAGLGAAGAFPYVAQPPASQTVTVGSMVAFNVIASGTGPLSYQWQKNGANIPNATNSSLSLPDAQVGSAGNYSVVVTNDYGTAASGPTNGVLTVLTGAPIITGQLPLATNNLSLYSPSFSITAEGNAPLYYQWFNNGVAISGATNAQYTPPDAQNSTNTFACIISNSIGTATSQVWSVTVLASPAPSYPQAVLALNPIGYWRMNETPNDGIGNQGVVCHDYAGGNDGVYSNVVLAQSGYNPITDPAETSTLFGTYASANSAANQIQNLDFSEPLGGNGEFTVTAWVNGYGYAQALNAGIVTKGYFYGEEMVLDEGVSPSADFRFSVRNVWGTDYSANSSINAANLNATTGNGWHFLVGVCDEADSNVLIYVDGALAGQVDIPPGSGIFSSSSAPLTIGARATSATSGNNHQFIGRIDDVAIYNYALSASQVRQLYAAAPAPVMSMTWSGGNMVINYTGQLLSATNVAGPYQPVPGASWPAYTVPLTNSQMFYRVNNQ